MVGQSKLYKQVKRVEENEEEEESGQERYALNNVTCIYKLDKRRKGGEHKESKYEYETNVKLKINNKIRVQIDSGADVNIMDYATYMKLNQPPPLKHSNAKLKLYNSKPIPVRGYFKASISADGKQVASKFYVTHSSNSVSILGKYTAFDLGILKISVKELTEAINMASAPFCSSIDSVHMSYSEMAKKLTPLSQATQVVNEIYEKDSQSATQEIIDRHSTVFKGISKHRYRQVELSIDKTVKPKVQPQRRAPFPKREQFDKILQELEGNDIIEPVEGPTELISNVVLNLKSRSISAQDEH